VGRDSRCNEEGRVRYSSGVVDLGNSLGFFWMLKLSIKRSCINVHLLFWLSYGPRLDSSGAM